MFNGVRGRLIDLLTLKSKRFTTALTVALGRHAEAVVCNTEAAALECIAYLRAWLLALCTLSSCSNPKAFTALEAFLCAPARERGGNLCALLDACAALALHVRARAGEGGAVPSPGMMDEVRRVWEGVPGCPPSSLSLIHISEPTRPY